MIYWFCFQIFNNWHFCLNWWLVDVDLNIWYGIFTNSNYTVRLCNVHYLVKLLIDVYALFVYLLILFVNLFISIFFVYLLVHFVKLLILLILFILFNCLFYLFWCFYYFVYLCLFDFNCVMYTCLLDNLQECGSLVD